MSILNFLIPVAMAVVLVILLTGVIVMARGGELNRKYGNRLMQMRVLAQLIAVILIALYFLVLKN